MAKRPEIDVGFYLRHIARHATDRVLAFEDGSVFAMIEVDGARPGPGSDINAWWRDVNDMVKSLGAAADRIAVSVYDTRGLASPDAYAKRTFRSAFAETLDQLYRDLLLEGRLLWTARLVVGIQLQPRQALGQTAGNKLRQLRRKLGGRQPASDDLVKELEDLCGRIAVQLDRAAPRRLGMVERDGGLYCEMKEFLAYAFTGVRREVPVTTGNVGNDILCEAVKVGEETIKIRGPGHTVYAACLSFKDYPTAPSPARSRALAQAQYLRTIVHVFFPMNEASAITRITRKQNKAVGAGDKAYKQIARLDEAANDITDKRYTFGTHNFVMTVFANDPLTLDRVCEQAWRDIIRLGGATAIREAGALVAAYFSMAPGSSLQARPGAITSRNFAALAPLHGFDKGAERGHWGAPIALLRTASGEPYRFHWHVQDVALAVVTGKSGAGKTLLGAFLINATIGRARVFCFDHKRGWHALIKANGGAYAVLGAGQAVFAPLRSLTDSDADIEFLLSLVRACIAAGGFRDLTAEEDRRLVLGLRTIMSLDPDDRSFGELREFLGSSRDGAGARLERWCAGNELGGVLDAPRDAIALDGELFGFDTTRLFANPIAAAPSILYLFYRIRRMLDGRPILLAADECWSVLDDPVFGKEVEAQIRTIRSKNGAVVLFTQSPEDLIKGGRGAGIVQQCPLQIHGVNTRITREQFVVGLSRTDEEFDIVRNLPRQQGLFLLCRDEESQVAQLCMGDLADEMAVLSTREEDHWAIDAAIAEAGDDPVRFVNLYHAYRKSQRETVA